MQRCSARCNSALLVAPLVVRSPLVLQHCSAHPSRCSGALPLTAARARAAVRRAPLTMERCDAPNAAVQREPLAPNAAVQREPQPWIALVRAWWRCRVTADRAARGVAVLRRPVRGAAHGSSEAARRSRCRGAARAARGAPGAAVQAPRSRISHSTRAARNAAIQSALSDSRNVQKRATKSDTSGHCLRPGA